MKDYREFKSKYNLVVVCGPTATGKTTLGVKLGNELEGEILSADSRQIYKGMDLGTGKDLHEYETPDGKVPYHLIDIVSPEEKYTLYHYIEDFYEKFRQIESREKTPILVGGTGLYIEAVLKHYRVANVPENEELRESLMVMKKEELAQQLKKESAEIYGKTDLSSKKRIIRSIEIAKYEKESPIEWGGENPPEFKPLIMGVRWPREELIQRIDQRLKARLQEGMIEEVRNLLGKGVTRNRMMMFGMEYKFITMFVQGEISYNEMYEKLKTSICRLAKRQMTWFRGMERRGQKIHWVERADYKTALKIIS